MSAAADAAAELMELSQAKPLAAFNRHQRGVGHIDADFDDAGGDERPASGRSGTPAWSSPSRRASCGRATFPGGNLQWFCRRTSLRLVLLSAAPNRHILLSPSRIASANARRAWRSASSKRPSSRQTSARFPKRGGFPPCPIELLGDLRAPRVVLRGCVEISPEVRRIAEVRERLREPNPVPEAFELRQHLVHARGRLVELTEVAMSPRCGTADLRPGTRSDGLVELQALVVQRGGACVLPFDVECARQCAQRPRASGRRRVRGGLEQPLEPERPSTASRITQNSSNAVASSSPRTGSCSDAHSSAPRMLSSSRAPTSRSMLPACWSATPSRADLASERRKSSRRRCACCSSPSSTSRVAANSRIVSSIQ